jgi:hypothetical protein
VTAEKTATCNRQSKMPRNLSAWPFQLTVSFSSFGRISFPGERRRGEHDDNAGDASPEAAISVIERQLRMKPPIAVTRLLSTPNTIAGATRQDQADRNCGKTFIEPSGVL